MNAGIIEGRIGYQFRDSGLLAQALTHRSHGTPNNERLEFLGDSVLNCVVARLLYVQFASLPEGDLSRMRANLVNQQSLCDIATRLDLGQLVMLGQGEVRSGGSQRPSILADALEAVIGAVFVDAGFESAATMIGTLYEPLISAIDPETVAKDPKTRLQELLQGKRLPLPSYTVTKVTGEAHEQLFRVECAISEMRIQTFGEGTSRRIAEQAAAMQAFEIATDK